MDDAIVLRPHLVTFDAYQVDGQYALTSLCDQVSHATA